MAPKPPQFAFEPLGFPWPTRDPFLFCAYHQDLYPPGDTELGVSPEGLSGRSLGMDFTIRDGFRMYHGQHVPGFPAHPHRGFETITLARHGLIDHSDSLGAAARFGEGDVQWMTAGRGIVHSEMFPLLRRSENNPAELFQIWLNLPRTQKMVAPHFKMFWADQIPRHQSRDAAGRSTEILTIAGAFEKTIPPTPPPASWAADLAHGVSVWTLRLEAKAQFTLPEPPDPAIHRALYFFRGDELQVGAHRLQTHHAAFTEDPGPIVLEAGEAPVEVLLLQGRPIGEPVAAHGPFVMTTRDEIHQAIADYQESAFGGWPHGRPDPTHGPDPRRFARYPDGRTEAPDPADRPGS